MIVYGDAFEENWYDWNKVLSHYWL